MNEFDLKARAWDMNPMHLDRSVAVVEEISRTIPLNPGMKALEYGAGTGIASFLLNDRVKEIVLMDNSEGMVKMLEEKILNSGVKNMRYLNFDLEHMEYNGGKFDLIFTQMVLHHIEDTDAITRKFSRLLNPGGYLAIADLYEEDGSFHGEGFDGHLGFDPEKLAEMLRNNGFTGVSYKKVFTVERKVSENESKSFDIFLLTGNR
jgi:tRNA (cmo5U34)-methyltransferase